MRDIRENVFKKLIGQNIRFYDENKVGELQSRVSSDISLLTGGQKQRIAIARAILRDSPILLLDEATSSLDAISENAIKTAIDNVSGNKTIIVIAHRLSTVKNADRILFLEKGKIGNDGSHRELMRTNKKYKKLAELQFL